ncbi:cytochrome b/b6 domain-containing protein [Telmatospirillum siberiense]|uniref:Cytochrome B n=1 Tax=Telmatospirillum siberiense TaxID=382514 RepID=A0A2N3PP21_9PROT|nr:cytochrome b/b6 domain-containing protein [Telmatospirillum siberiense]PKU22173.1 cytochrome B [Telmatospirillum siberiense]
MSADPPTSPSSAVVYPRWLRISHWLNALAVPLMMGSGWRIYDAAPLFAVSIPREVTLGGWLGGALQWHFAAMWLLAGNGLFYLTVNLVGGRLFRRFFPVSPRGVLADAVLALRGRLRHDDPGRYNQVQRAAYLFATLDLVVLAMSGLVLWKSVQFAVLRDLLGGYEAARLVHFVAMVLLAGFVALHLVMVALVPRTLPRMIRGR